MVQVLTGKKIYGLYIIILYYIYIRIRLYSYRCIHIYIGMGVGQRVKVIYVNGDNSQPVDFP